MKYKIAKILKLIYFVGFLLAVASAFPGYVQSSFFKSFVAIEWVGIFYVFATVFSMLAINYFPYLIKRFSNYRLSLITAAGFFLSAIALTQVQVAWQAILAYSFMAMFGCLLWINMDVFVEEFSSDKTTGNTRTFYYTILNIGWVFSPLVVGYLVGADNYRLIYFASAMMAVPIFFLILSQKKSLHDKVKYEHHSSWLTLKKVWHSVSLRGIYAAAFLLQIFYVSAVVYLPIYLNKDLGFTWATLGWMFTFMLLPFLLFEIPMGKLADKYSNEKHILMLGFLILSSAVALWYFAESTSPIAWASMLFLSRCGASLIEAMRETYFFKVVDAKDIDYINLFRNVGPAGYLVGTGLSVLVLRFFTIKELFLFTAIILLSGIYFSLRLKKPALVKKER